MQSEHFLGILQNFPVDFDEYLMIMFYDILLLNNIACIKENLD